LIVEIEDKTFHSKMKEIEYTENIIRWDVFHCPAKAET